MFEITSYEPSPEADSFNQAVGLVEATKVAALPSKTTELTPEQKQEKLAVLTAIAETTLDTYKVSELREVAKGLLPRVNSYLKNDLKTLLLEIRSTELARLEAILIAAKQTAEARKERIVNTEPQSIATRVSGILKDLQAIAWTDSTETEAIINTAAYASKIHAGLAATYAPTTVKTLVSDISKELSGVAAEGRLAVVLQCFLTALSKAFRSTADAIKASYAIQVKTNTENNIKVNGTALIGKAISVLTLVRDGATGVQWQHVVIALAVVTGRRSAEILASGLFKSSDKTSTILFSGQAKVRGDIRAERMAEFKEIPVLCNSELVLEGFRWLVQSGRRKDDPNEVNNTCATPLKRSLVLWQSMADTDKLTVKSLRAIYASLCIMHFYQGNVNGTTAYIARILGHHESDMTTAHSYQGYEVY